MSLLLAKMQVESNGDYFGSNAKVFPVLAIEEPEAHLHPTMQHQIISFFEKNIQKKKVKQIFITTHSTHIASATNLDNLICLYTNEGKKMVSYPGKTFTPEQLKSKKYVQRFLDATKSNMLLSEKIILVEGIAEQLLVNIFAEYLGISLEEEHVSVINVGGRYFEHFLNLFDSNNPNTINRKVACITDLDPLRKSKSNDTRFKKCYPFEYDDDTQNYEYKHNTISEKYSGNNHPNIRFFIEPGPHGKTLEYLLAFENPTLKLLITDSISNNDELEELIESYDSSSVSELLNILKDNKENERISHIKNITTWTEVDKKKAIIASRYLNSISKGAHALELSSSLKENLNLKETEEYQEFNVPKYIEEAIRWVVS